MDDDYESEWKTTYKHTFKGPCAGPWQRLVYAGHDDESLSPDEWRRKRAQVPGAAGELMICIGAAVVAKRPTIAFEVYPVPEFFASDVEDLATMAFFPRVHTDRDAVMLMLQLFYNADGEITFSWWRSPDDDPIFESRSWFELSGSGRRRQAPPFGKLITQLASLAAKLKP